ncbi:uncharacterized protein LOC110858771 isoform X2 [Folsomia candida]|uniref:uncharacterized protein LOC110858771 isoform X2 n=1 Tax=Folsomia candida TaxID=158441 RepID=UPI000B8F0CB3|nr:uncharacterized protein LOC110858771 isoform X2 [Folsomia candida]
MFTCTRASNVKSILISNEHQINTLDEVLGICFSLAVTRINIMDTYIRTDAQQHYLFLLLEFIGQKCNQPNRVKKLDVFLVTNTYHNRHMDETEYTINARTPADVYQNIYKKANMGGMTQFKFKSQSNFHDRSISVLTEVAGTPTVYQIRLGKGLDFYEPCDCKVFRPNNKYDFDSAQKRYLVNENKQYEAQHYVECVEGKTTDQFSTVRTDITIITWREIENFKMIKLYEAIFKYNTKGDIGDLLVFKS